MKHMKKAKGLIWRKGEHDNENENNSPNILSDIPPPDSEIINIWKQPPPHPHIGCELLFL